MSNNTRFERILQPIQLGTMEVKNRFVLAPMYSCSATRDGRVTGQTKICYRERAGGGAGLSY